jgi:hypothetical protein
VSSILITEDVFSSEDTSWPRTCPQERAIGRRVVREDEGEKRVYTAIYRYRLANERNGQSFGVLMEAHLGFDPKGTPSLDVALFTMRQ